MIEIYGDLFEVAADVICITTNGFVCANGDAVMGRGCALAATKLVPNIQQILGSAIKTKGNVPNFLSEANGVKMYSFPVKPASGIKRGRNVVEHMERKFAEGSSVPGWAMKGDIDTIKQSAQYLVALANHHGWQCVVLPRPGCGAGELDWHNSIKPMLEGILDDRFAIITFPRKY